MGSSLVLSEPWGQGEGPGAAFESPEGHRGGPPTTATSSLLPPLLPGPPETITASSPGPWTAEVREESWAGYPPLSPSTQCVNNTYKLLGDVLSCQSLSAL